MLSIKLAMELANGSELMKLVQLDALINPSILILTALNSLLHY